jgi:hypothetical protein
VAFLNPGLQWWTTGHEQTDIDFGGYRNGVGGVVLAYLSSGCQSAFNNSVGGPACPVDTPAGFGPGSNGLLDLGGPNNRFQNAYMVKSLIKPATDQNILLAGNLNLPTGTSLQSYADNLAPVPFEISASSIRNKVFNGSVRTSVLSNQNLITGGAANLPSGVSLSSIDDALATYQNLEILASNIRLSPNGGGGLYIGATAGVTCGGVTAGTVTVSNGIVTHC